MKTTITDFLPLDRPLIIFDLETTGLSTVEDKILEIAYEKIMPNGEIIAEVLRMNPGMPIPEVATKINGFSDADVANAPSFARLAYGLWNMFDGADVGGFNITGFDLPFLRNTFASVGKTFDFSQKKILDAKILYHSKEPRDMFKPRNLTAAYKLYCGKEHVNAHSGAADVRVTIEILEEILKRYPELCNWDTIHELHGNKALLESAKTEHAPILTLDRLPGALF